MKKDRTVRLLGVMYEVPIGLIDRQVELRFHPDKLLEVEIFFQNKSYGMAIKVDPHVNSIIGRNWEPHSNTQKPARESMEVATEILTGQLF